MSLTIRLPKPTTLQTRIRSSAGKRNVLCAGRRGGKTTLAALVSVEKMLQGRRVLLAAPTEDQTDAYWEKCKAWLADLIQAGLVYKNETKHLLTMASSGGRIRAKTAWNADTLRGDYADLLIMDEAALMGPDAWDKVGAPMLLDNDGEAWFISTPKRRNHFFEKFQRAEQDGERWRAWRFTSFDNPHLSQEALDEIIEDLSKAAYEQEIMAQFLEDEGIVFRNIAACLNAPAHPKPSEHDGHHVVMGVDWGRQRDFTALSVVCADCRVELALDRFGRIEWAFQRARLKNLAQRWAVKTILAEMNAMGEPNVEALRREGLPVQGWTMTGVNKPPLIESLALAFERAECQWRDDPVARSELESFEAKISGTTGRPSYSAPEGLHDDTVIARALAWQARGRRVLIGFA